MSSKMRAVATQGIDKVLTSDEHGVVERSLDELIKHAANRHAMKHGGKFFLN